MVIRPSRLIKVVIRLSPWPPVVIRHHRLLKVVTRLSPWLQAAIHPNRLKVAIRLRLLPKVVTRPNLWPLVAIRHNYPKAVTRLSRRWAVTMGLRVPLNLGICSRGVVIPFRKILKVIRPRVGGQVLSPAVTCGHLRKAARAVMMELPKVG